MKLKFFDYLYISSYRVCVNVYGGEPEFESSCFVAAMQAFNILSIPLIYSAIKGQETFDVPKIYAGIVMFSFIVLNYIRYIRISRFHYKIIIARWEMESKKNQRIQKRLQAIYVLATLIVFVGLIAFFASQK